MWEQHMGNIYIEVQSHDMSCGTFCVFLTESSDADAGHPSHCWCRTGMLVKSEMFLFTCKQKKNKHFLSHSNMDLDYFSIKYN